MQDDIKLMIILVVDDIMISPDKDDLYLRELAAPKDKPVPIGINVAVKKIAKKNEFFGLIFVDQVG